jgi:outer membrane PBP1 activator LpoA protein
MQKKIFNGTLKYFSSTLLCVALLFMQGCSGIPLLNDTVNLSQPGDVSIQQANDLLKRGDKAGAAESYFRAAAAYPSPQRERIILQAAEITASMGDTKATNRYLSGISPSALDGENRGRHAYVLALLALQQNNPSLALSTLPTNLAGLSPALREKVQHIRTRAQQLGGKSGGQVNVQNAMIPDSSNHIAVLLPQSGALGGVSQDIIQGMQSARSSLGGDSSVQLYDVSAGGAVAQYQKAVAEGADIIVGPLDKESLAQLLAQPQILTKPILSLNYLTSTHNIPGALYQFGLLPEDEARQVADFALSRGQRSAIILTPASSWGERVAGAFQAAYQGKGGQVVAHQSYADAPSGSYMQDVQSALASAQGRASMIFLAASPTQARMMKPLLSAQAASLPVYATSHIFSGRTDPSQDNDLDGIIYTEIPWVLEAMQNGTLNNSKYPRMFALGMDAFLIAKNLPSIARNPGARVNGKTGNISLASNRQIQRTLLFATFASGLPRALGQ